MTEATEYIDTYASLLVVGVLAFLSGRQGAADNNDSTITNK